MATTLLIDALFIFGIYSYARALSLTTGIMTFIILTFGEITPKNIAMKNPTKLALLITPILYYVIIILKPIIIILTAISNLISNFRLVPCEKTTKYEDLEYSPTDLFGGAKGGLWIKCEAR